MNDVSYSVAFLGEMAPAVRQVMSSRMPEDLNLRFSGSNEDADLATAARNADFFVVGIPQIAADLIDLAPGLRLIHKFGIGVDTIDLAHARARSIPVAITAGANSGPVAEHALMLMLAVSRNVAWADRELRAGRWQKTLLRERCSQLRGKTIGIVGFGEIGQCLARLLAGFEVDILYSDPTPVDPTVEAAVGVRGVGLDELLSTSDIVSLHLPLLDPTTGLLDERAFAAMKPGAILVNTSRGPVVDEIALLAALDSGHLRGAGLDVFAQEPLPENHPLLAYDQVVLTPHTAGGVLDNVPRVTDHIIGNIMRVAQGERLSYRDLVR